MVDNEIIKALEDTLNRIRDEDCLIVPKEGVENLCNGLENALNLINRQQLEYDNLQKQFHYLDIECDRLEKANETLNAKIETLKKAVDIHKGIAEDWKYEARRLKEIVGEE